MTKDKDEQDFLASARKTLDSGSDNLDASIRRRLTRARMTALNQKKGGGARRWLWMVAPLTAGLAIALVVSVYFQGGREGIGSVGEVADLEIITALESPEFYADLEFYQWLAEGDGHAGG